MKLEEFRARYGGMGKSSFLARFFDPFLVVSTALSASQCGRPAFTKSTILPEGKEPVSVVTLVFPVAKTGEGPPGAAITVGRGQQNDIVIPHPSISRTHAFFEVDNVSESIHLTDTGSSYGTEVEGKALSPRTPEAVHGSAKIVFGKVAHCTLFTPADLYNYLQVLDT